MGAPSFEAQGRAGDWSAAPQRRGSRFSGLARILIFDVVGPLWAYSELKKHGYSDVQALVLSGLFPVLGVVGHAVRTRRLDTIGVVVLLGIAAAATLGAVTDDPKLILLEGAIPTGIFALACLFTLGAYKPLIYRFAEAGLGGEESPRAQNFARQYDAQPGMRRYFRIVTAVWGVAFLLEAGVKVWVTQTQPTGFALTFSRIAPYPLAAVLVLWMFVYSHRSRRARRAAMG